MRYRVEIATQNSLHDVTGDNLLSEIREMDVKTISDVNFVRVYLIEGDFSTAEAKRHVAPLLADGITEKFAINGPVIPDKGKNITALEINRKPGVTDPVEASVIKALADKGLTAKSVHTARKYIFHGSASRQKLETLAKKLLANEVIEDIRFGPPFEHHWSGSSSYTFERNEVDLLKASENRLMEISKEGTLSLNIKEMRTVQNYFRKIGRNPTDVELETIAQTWSEHCCHKTLKGNIRYNGKMIKNLLKSTIARVTTELKKPWCVSVFEDNAGIIRFDDKNNICFKVETHNHPSAIEPYGGAGTGIGGVIRDILGTGLGAKPIMNTDVFCFGEPTLPQTKLPKGTLHPKRIMKGVVSGVRDYGNRMGIPTANGALYFDNRYVGNPLVYCGTVGIIPRDKCKKEAKKGDYILAIGGRTGRDGIHGATFSSVELTEDSETVSSGAVQIGNPIEEKKCLDVLMKARDLGLYSCITDCGAGGFSSAVGEMGEKLGAEVHLDQAPLKYQGLSPYEIWISEAQERMVLAVPKRNLKKILKLFRDENVESTVIGTFTGDKQLRLYYKKHLVADIEMKFIHEGLPKFERTATWKLPRHKEPKLKLKKNYNSDLKKILGAWNVCSKEWIIRQYDHEVQGASILKPLQGVANDGPGDAAVIAPVYGKKKGIIVSNGLNPKYSDIDPYWMAAAGIDEALRNIIAVGGSLKEVALLDNYSWGNTNKPEHLGALVRASQACYDIAKVYGTPFISGKDSLNNEYTVGKKTIVIPHTLLISAIAVMDDVTKAVSMDAKRKDGIIYAVGMTKRELGGSHYYDSYKAIGNSVPEVDAKSAKKIFEALSGATGKRLVDACHDMSEGGLAVAAAEMAFSGGLGMQLALSALPRSKDVKRDDEALFSESQSRFLVEVSPNNTGAFEKLMKGVPFAAIGIVTEKPRLQIRDLKNNGNVIDVGIADLKEAWQKPLRW